MPISQYLRRIRERVGTELLIMPSVTGLVWSENGVLLLQHEKDGPWSFPGGLVDPGEYPAEALVREIREECGVLARPTSIIGVFGGPEGFKRTYPNGDRVEFVDVVFSCVAIEGSPECKDGEAVAARYFQAAQVSTLPLSYPIPFHILIQERSDVLFFWEPRWENRASLNMHEGFSFDNSTKN